jgi:hypothetical protein
MLAQLEKTLSVPLVWLVPSVSLVGENVNSGHLTYHPEDPRGILTALVSRYGAHYDLLPNEVKHAKLFFVRSHPHKNVFGNV